MRERHSQNRIAGLQVRHEDGHICLRAAVRLHVGMIGAEDRFEAVDGERFRDVDPFATAVIAFARIALRVLVGHDAAHRFAYGFARVVFRRDQLQVLLLALFLAGDCGENLGIFGFDVTAR